MFKFFRRRGGNLRDDNASDIITENAQINVSDSAPILNNRYDLNTGNNGTSVHDLRRSEEPGGKRLDFVFLFFLPECVKKP